MGFLAKSSLYLPRTVDKTCTLVMGWVGDEIHRRCIIIKLSPFYLCRFTKSGIIFRSWITNPNYFCFYFEGGVVLNVGIFRFIGSGTFKHLKPRGLLFVEMQLNKSDNRVGYLKGSPRKTYRNVISLKAYLHEVLVFFCLTAKGPHCPTGSAESPKFDA